jgi:hypothetical protein
MPCLHATTNRTTVFPRNHRRDVSMFVGDICKATTRPSCLIWTANMEAVLRGGNAVKWSSADLRRLVRGCPDRCRNRQSDVACPEPVGSGCRFLEGKQRYDQNYHISRTCRHAPHGRSLASCGRLLRTLLSDRRHRNAARDDDRRCRRPVRSPACWSRRWASVD